MVLRHDRRHPWLGSGWACTSQPTRAPSVGRPDKRLGGPHADRQVDCELLGRHWPEGTSLGGRFTTDSGLPADPACGTRWSPATATGRTWTQSSGSARSLNSELNLLNLELVNQYASIHFPSAIARPASQHGVNLGPGWSSGKQPSNVQAAAGGARRSHEFDRSDGGRQLSRGHISTSLLVERGTRRLRPLAIRCRWALAGPESCCSRADEVGLPGVRCEGIVVPGRGGPKIGVDLTVSSGQR